MSSSAGSVRLIRQPSSFTQVRATPRLVVVGSQKPECGEKAVESSKLQGERLATSLCNSSVSHRFALRCSCQQPSRICCPVQKLADTCSNFRFRLPCCTPLGIQSLSKLGDAAKLLRLTLSTSFLGAAAAALAATVLLTTAIAPGEALAARSGGRVGGSSFRSSAPRSAPRAAAPRAGYELGLPSGFSIVAVREIHLLRSQRMPSELQWAVLRRFERAR